MRSEFVCSIRNLAIIEVLPKKSCRSCSSKSLVSILDLGIHNIANFSDSPNQEPDSAPLELILCNKRTDGCGLVQLRHTVERLRLYKQYWYRSGINQTMRDALADITAKAESLVALMKNDVVIDIGSNDSTLLRSYKIKGLELVGFEPSHNLMQYANVDKGNIINDFFSYNSFHKIYENVKAKVITSIAVFYHLDDPNVFVEDIRKCLDKDGIWIIQLNDLVSMFKQNAFDNIGFEHLEFYSLEALEHLLQRHSLEVFDIEINDINGGSYRVYVKHAEGKIKTLADSADRVNKLRKYEEDMHLNDLTTYKEFVQRVEKIKHDVYNFIKTETSKGKKVYIYGASTRGNTLLQYLNLDHTVIKAAAERNSEKWGKFIVGSKIPIISEEQARSEKPDYFLVLPWAFINEFVTREKEYLKGGGKFIVPLPDFKIIGDKT